LVELEQIDCVYGVDTIAVLEQIDCGYGVDTVPVLEIAIFRGMFGNVGFI
jgi:hypothetical protein